MSRLSLVEQLTELSEAAPIDLDPEDVQAGANPEDGPAAIDSSAAREHYVDVAPSAIRKLHDSVSDPKYDGVRTTRKQLFEDDAESDEERNSFVESVPSQSGSDEPSDFQEDEDDENEDASVSGQQDQEEESGRDELPSDHAGTPRVNGARGEVTDSTQQNEDFASALRKTREDDRQRGKAVSRQIALYDTLLDTRIQLQKVVTAANRLPYGTTFQILASQQAARESLSTMFGEAVALSEELFSLQETLLQQNESITPPLRKRRRTDHGSDSQLTSHDHYAEQLRDLCEDASALDASYHSWLVHTLAKWSAKVQAVAPSVLLGGNRAFNKDDRSRVGVVTMIDDILRTDGEKLLGRTRVRRSKGGRIGLDAGPGSGPAKSPHEHAVEEDDEEREDPEVFDDLDFYQQLLRDVIRARGGDLAGGEQDWVAQQRDRKARKKLKVDTKASKGRKLRYEVHTKLQNFMVPVPVVHGAWHEEQIDGLFSSLLGAA